MLSMLKMVDFHLEYKSQYFPPSDFWELTVFLDIFFRHH